MEISYGHSEYEKMILVTTNMNLQTLGELQALAKSLSEKQEAFNQVGP